MSPITAWILENIQIDLGNLVVGIATIFIAMVTLRTTMANIRMEANHRIASFRVSWIENLRTEVSKFIGAAHILKKKASEGIKDEIDDLHTDIMRIESYILLMLNPNEAEHRILKDELEQTRSSLSLFAQSRDAGLGRQIDQDLKTISDTTSRILKSEWDRASAEIKKKS
ncbi:hypothetical protein V5F38_07510 [Xanthobacter sp. V0B-10]|uniref:hypothetical protein n=1 Tax=Xanthobacter albus TaxID=3119929 RepID=UPI003728C340